MGGVGMNKELTVMQELFMQLKLQLGNNKVSQMFDEVYWLAKEQNQIEKAFDDGFVDGVDSKYGVSTKYEESKDYYKSKYGGEI